MQRLLDQLNSRDKELRAKALREAQTLTPDELLQLVLLADGVCSRRRKRSNVVYYSFFIALISAIILTPLSTDKWMLRFLFLCQFSAGPIKNGYDNKYDMAIFSITTLLHETEDVRLAAQMLRLNHEKANKSLCTALRRLLPQIRADHGLQWSKEDKAALLLPLKRPEQDRDLTLACLSVLEQIGDASAVPAVRRLLEKTYPVGSQNNIAVAARECLLYLESATNKQHQAETLLRASDPNSTRPEILLRPAAPTPDNSTREQLLRPTE